MKGDMRVLYAPLFTCFILFPASPTLEPTTSYSEPAETAVHIQICFEEPDSSQPPNTWTPDITRKLADKAGVEESRIDNVVISQELIQSIDRGFKGRNVVLNLRLVEGL